MHTPGRLHERLEGGLKSLLHFLVADNEAALLITADQSDLLVTTSIEFVNTSKHVAEIDDGVALGVHGVENVIAEELEEIALPGIRPAGVQIIFRAFID